VKPIAATILQSMYQIGNAIKIILLEDISKMGMTYNEGKTIDDIVKYNNVRWL
jgi:hypothetical protein